MTPAERLIAAADLLEKRAEDAIPGPWSVYGNEHGVTAIIGGHDREFSVTEDRELASEEAHYIATMHPEVGKAIAAWLRDVGESDEGNVGAARRIADLLLAGAS